MRIHLSLEIKDVAELLALAGARAFEWQVAEKRANDTGNIHHAAFCRVEADRYLNLKRTLEVEANRGLSFGRAA